MQGKVVLQLVVLKDGTVGNVEGIHGDEILLEAALKAMKKTPNWNPAVQNGSKVISYLKLPVSFD